MMRALAWIGRDSRVFIAWDKPSKINQLVENSHE